MVLPIVNVHPWTCLVTVAFVQRTIRSSCRGEVLWLSFAFVSNRGGLSVHHTKLERRDMSGRTTGGISASHIKSLVSYLLGDGRSGRFGSEAR